MSETERKAAIEAHRLAHEAKQAHKRNARYARAERNKRRGLDAFIARLKEAQ